MLNKGFFNFETVKFDEATLTGHIELNKEHAIYDGHFPGTPVTPGVCQVEMIKEIFSDFVKEELHLIKARDIKFMNMINPAEIRELNYIISFIKEDDNYKINATLSKGDVTFLKMRGIFGKLQA